MNLENARNRQATQPASNDCDAIIQALLYHLADIDVTKNTVRGQDPWETLAGTHT